MESSWLQWAYDFFIEPFASYLFLRRPLVACFAMALGCGPMGVMLVLRRMSLMGDAISHAILPGVAIGFLIAGLSIPVMSLTGFITGTLVALSAGVVSRRTILREDASFAAFYLLFLGMGVLIISTQGGGVDLMSVLLGTILSVNISSLLLVSTISSLTLILFAIFYRPLILSSYDSPFLTSIGGRPAVYQNMFLCLVVLNLVSAFQAIGTLMALGLMLLPAVAARFWATQVWCLCVVAGGITFVSGYGGLLLSYHSQWPSGPSIIMMAGLFYLISLIFGPHGSLTRKGQLT